MKQPVMKLTIAPVKSAIGDILSNISWIVVLTAILVLYTLASSAVIRIWEDWGYWHSCYFTLINMTTVGFGDVTPITQQGKIVSGLNSVVGLILFGIFVASITIALQPSSFDGTAEFNGVSLINKNDEESQGSNEEKALRFLEAVNGLVSLGEESEEERLSETPKVVDLLIDVEDRSNKSKCVHVRVNIRARNG